MRSERDKLPPAKPEASGAPLGRYMRGAESIGICSLAFRYGPAWTATTCQVKFVGLRGTHRDLRDDVRLSQLPKEPIDRVTKPLVQFLRVSSPASGSRIRAVSVELTLQVAGRLQPENSPAEQTGAVENLHGCIPVDEPHAVRNGSRRAGARNRQDS